MPASFIIPYRIVDIVARIQGPALPKDEEIATAPSQDQKTLLWELIAEKTGYPSEVLALSMDLESDLGIDSIKRVEILSALTEKRPELKDRPATDVRTLNDLLLLLEEGQGKFHPKADDESLAESLLHPESSEWDLSSKKKARAKDSMTLNSMNSKNR